MKPIYSIRALRYSGIYFKSFLTVKEPDLSDDLHSCTPITKGKNHSLEPMDYLLPPLSGYILRCMPMTYSANET